MKTVISFNRIGKTHGPPSLEHHHPDPIPDRESLTSAIRQFCLPYIQFPDMMNVDIVFSTSVETDTVDVSIALDNGLMGYGSGSVVDLNEPPC